MGLIVNTKLEQIRSQHSHRWMGSDAIESLSEVHVQGSVEHLHQLRSMQSAIANFVQIITNKNIPVIFSSGNQSYTDGKQVIISGKIDMSMLDVQIGLALHEASHCLLSNKSFEFLPHFELHTRKVIDNVGVPSIWMDAARLGLQEREVASLIHMMMNYLEDRRIDLYMYENASGYRPYYESLYNYYWHSSKIDNALRSPDFRELTIQNYELFVLNMTNQYWDASALPELDKIRKIVNFTPAGLNARGDGDAGWSKTPLLLRDAVLITEIILRNSKSKENSNSTTGDGDPIEAQDSNGMPNMDMAPGGQDTKYSRPSLSDVTDAINNQKDFMSGRAAIDDKQSLPSHINNQIDTLNKSNSTICTVSGNFSNDIKCNVVVYRDVTRSIVTSGAFPMSRGSHDPNSSAAWTDGVRMGQILAHKLQIIQEDKPIKFTRQETGRLDKRLISGLGYGNESVFHHILVEAKDPVDVWIDIDLSGSMDGSKLKNAMQVAVAIAYAADKNRQLNCTVAIRNSSGSAANVAIIYDSKRHTISQLRDVVPYISAAGGTPEGLCFESIKNEILKKNDGVRKYFINLSDGEPAHSFERNGNRYSYSGDVAAQHTRKLMKEFRAAGINVLSYFIGNYDVPYRNSLFDDMYGNDAAYVNVNNVTSIARTLNKLIIGN